MSKRIFTSFAIEDERLRDLFVGQARNERVPYEFVDMSVKEAWKEDWKRNCEIKMKGCDGVIVLITKNIKNASGVIWEIECAKRLMKPILGIYVGDATSNDAPSELYGVNKIQWSWMDIKKFINTL